VTRMGNRRGAYRVLVGRPVGKRPLERPRSKWEGNTKRDLQKAGWGGMNRIKLSHDRDRWRALVHAVMKPGVP
jgi:hypothetical protein